MLPVASVKATYSHSVLGPRRDEFVAAFTEDFDRVYTRQWEASLNDILFRDSPPQTGDRPSP